MMKTSLMICMIVIVPGSMGDTLWRAVNVDTIKIVTELSTVTSVQLSSHQCGAVCDGNPTCFSWNYENQVCNLTDLLVSPLHKATTLNTVKFYTNLEKDFSVGSTVTAFSPQWTTAYASNLAKGIYNKSFPSTCYGSNSKSTNIWLLFELQSTQMIRQIRITSKPGGSTAANLIGAEIRVGSLSPNTSGDFSSYRLFGILPNSVANGKTYIIKSINGGITGRFVSIKRTPPTNIKSLGVCHIHIA